MGHRGGEEWQLSPRTMGKHSDSDETVLLQSPRLPVILKVLQSPIKMKDVPAGKEELSHKYCYGLVNTISDLVKSKGNQFTTTTSFSLDLSFFSVEQLRIATRAAKKST
jgi:hypothetical protein